LRRSLADLRPPPTLPAGSWPPVTVQLPLFNEPTVARRLIEAVAAILYPAPLEIQILDDSTDETTGIVETTLRSLTIRPDVTLVHLRRGERRGFKAGALADGMARSDGRFFAVFDADFVPHPEVLTSMMPHFADPRVGMVQSRWGHLNREASVLTQVQAIYLDGHFAVESAARFLSSRFFNFNGTAGIWRREAIESAGGWSASTLTEDLDLSYRSQLAGWKFVFVPQIEIAAELPSTLQTFQDQQHRWAKGSVQTARKVLPRMLRSDFPLHVKIEALFHLTNNSAYLLTLIVGLLLVPAILIRQRLGLTWMLAVDGLLFACSTLSVIGFYLEGQRRVGRPRPSLRALLSLLPVGIGISARNAAAVLEGMVHRGGFFGRTPKMGDSDHHPPPEKPPRIPLAELILASFFAAALITFSVTGQYVSIPFILLFFSGYAWVAIIQSWERVRYVRSQRVRRTKLR